VKQFWRKATVKAENNSREDLYFSVWIPTDWDQYRKFNSDFTSGSSPGYGY